MVWLGAVVLSLAAAGLSDAPRQSHVYGGDEVARCGWPTTVSMQGSCTGTLVHPQVVIYAAHCSAGIDQVVFGENIGGIGGRAVRTEYCRTYPGGGPGGGNDFAFCVLAEPQNDIPIVPPLMGCETSVLTPGREVAVVGFGNDEFGGYGRKREVYTEFVTITGSNEAYVGGEGKDSCQGDSGGPVYVRLPNSAGGDDTWRVFGITSYGTTNDCGPGGYYSMMHIGMEWFEQESGFDLTPCHDADGTWNPGPLCKGFPKDAEVANGSWDEGCSPALEGGLSAICGEPFDVSSDQTAPTVAVAAPMNGQRFDSEPGSDGAPLMIEVDADDADGYGIDTLDVLVNGEPIPMGTLTSPPFVFPATFPPGTYEISARAVDFSGNMAEAEAVYIGVDMDAVVPEAGSTGGDETSGASGDSVGGTDSTDSGDSGTSGGLDEGGNDEGCGCTTDPSRRGELAFGLLLLLFGSVRRRRG
jgi:MYXO-CTERM domain-containing protein